MDGDGALAGARYGLALKSADAPAAAASSGADELSASFRRRYGLADAKVGSISSPAVESKQRLVTYSQQGLMIAGKTFFQNANNQWVDSLTQQFAKAQPQRIQFNSTEYFEFAAKYPRTLPWLAVGPNLQFVFEGKVYEVYE